jgi:hypothetical protein
MKIKRAWRHGLAVAALFPAALVVFTLIDVSSWAQISCGDAPPAPPKRIAGGEGFAPLPLPVTPLRRTERKRPPAPPTLMAKVNYGTRKVSHQGRQVWDWTTAMGDMKYLFRHAQSVLGINYKGDMVRLDRFSYKPEEVPIMYFTGSEAIKLPQEVRAKLRQYVLDGGAILGAAGSGSGEFAKTFVAEMRQIFPNRPWRALPSDHPVFRSRHKIEKVEIKLGAGKPRSVAPTLEGLNVGCRTAILFSTADLSCGWDNHTHDYGLRVMPPDAKKLGANILAYQLAYYDLGLWTSTPVVYNELGDTTEEIAVAQIVHEGDWDPSPASLQFLLKAVSDETSGFVDYRRAPVDLEKADLANYPLAFLTGHNDFTLSAKAVENLRNYLDHGGALLVSNCCNRREFDRAVRRETAKLYPKGKLRPLDSTHPAFSAHHDLTQKSNGKLRLEGLERDGRTAVLYSPSSMSTAWDMKSRPYVDLPDPSEARDLGVNCLVYAMTH